MLSFQISFSMIGLDNTKGLEMYIKHNSIAKSIAIFSFFSSHAFEIVTDLNIGMQTNDRQLCGDDIASRDLLYNATIRKQAASSLGYVAAEYADIDLGVDFNVDNDFYIMPRVGLKFINKRLDFGLKAAYASNLYHESMRFSTFLDVYHSWFYDSLSVSDHLPIEVDYGVQLDVCVNDFLDMRIAFTQPAIFGHSFKYREHEFEISNKNSVAIGVSWHLLAEYSDLKDEYVHIIQEPISIPRIDLISAPKLTEKAMEAPVELPEDIEQIDEPLGWFAWIIEFIASLFRF